MNNTNLQSERHTVESKETIDFNDEQGEKTAKELQILLANQDLVGSSKTK